MNDLWILIGIFINAYVAAAARSTVMRLWPTMRQIQMHQLLLLHSTVPTLYSALQCVTQFRMCHACIPTFALPLRMFDRQLSNQSVLHNLIESEGNGHAITSWIAMIFATVIVWQCKIAVDFVYILLCVKYQRRAERKKRESFTKIKQ